MRPTRGVHAGRGSPEARRPHPAVGPIAHPNRHGQSPRLHNPALARLGLADATSIGMGTLLGVSPLPDTTVIRPDLFESDVV
jgi:hypothetical protein